MFFLVQFLTHFPLLSGECGWWAWLRHSRAGSSCAGRGAGRVPPNPGQNPGKIGFAYLSSPSSNKTLIKFQIQTVGWLRGSFQFVKGQSVGGRERPGQT